MKLRAREVTPRSMMFGFTSLGIVAASVSEWMRLALSRCMHVLASQREKLDVLDRHPASVPLGDNAHIHIGGQGRPPPPYKRIIRCLSIQIVLATAGTAATAVTPLPPDLAPHFRPPAEFSNASDGRRSPLLRADGTRISDARDWPAQREAIRRQWFDLMGPWPELLAAPRLEKLKVEPRDNFQQHTIRLEVAPGFMTHAILLVPNGAGPFPAVVVPFYDPETSVGLAGKPLRDFGSQLAKRGFVTLSIGAPGGDARLPAMGDAKCQPLAFLGYIAANCHTALARMPEVHPSRIGIIGHSYGGKWAMFGSCLYDKFACAVWSDPGIVFDEARTSVNYQEPWYLGLDAATKRAPGLVSARSPRTGAYKIMVERGHDLHELHALMAPRPFLVSGGSEDGATRWKSLHHALQVNRLLGFTDRVGMTNRPTHDPTVESNEVIYRFLEHVLGAAKR
jgi:dienelactone hydrolase